VSATGTTVGLAERWVTTARRVRDGRLEVDRGGAAWRALVDGPDGPAPTVAALLAVHGADPAAPPSLGGYEFDGEGLGRLVATALDGDGRVMHLLRSLFDDHGLGAAGRLWDDADLTRTDERWHEIVAAVDRERASALEGRQRSAHRELLTDAPPPELDTHALALAEAVGSERRLQRLDDGHDEVAGVLPWLDRRRARSDPAARIATAQLAEVMATDADHQRHLAELRTREVARNRDAWRPRVGLAVAVVLPLLIASVWRPDVTALFEGGDGSSRSAPPPSASTPAPAAPTTRELAVTATELNVRGAPALDAPVVDTLLEGEVVTSQAEHDDGERTWHEVQTSRDVWGWASGRYLEPAG
jgi:hypothetical protein